MNKDRNTKVNSKDSKKKQNQKQRDDDLVDTNNSSSNISIGSIITWLLNNKTIVIVGVLLFFVAYFQIRYEQQQRYSPDSLKEDQDDDHWEILGLSSGSDSGAIRAKFKELSKIWHPDLNPNCKECPAKFRKITNAKDALLNELSGAGQQKSIFNSQPVLLTTKNYHKLVEESTDLWIIFVYENTAKSNHYNQKYADIFSEVHNKYKAVVKFGVVEIVNHSNLLHYLPFKFAFFPNLISYQHGEGGELFPNIDSFSVASLTNFVENSYVNKVQLIDDSKLKTLIEGKEQKTEIKSLDYNALTVNLVYLSTKSYVELMIKDFAKSYENALTVYQNDIGFYDKFVKILDADKNNKFFVIYNDIVKEGDKYFLKKEVIAIPVRFIVSKRYNEDLHKAFSFVRKLLIQRLYRNNYARHCKSPPKPAGLAFDEVTRLDLCVVLLERSGQRLNMDTMLEFHSLVLKGFKDKLSKTESKKKKTEKDEYKISINYGITSLDQNPEVGRLFGNNTLSKNINVAENEISVMIINDSKESFLFKNFKDPKHITEDLMELNTPDVYEDIALGLRPFSDYEIKKPSYLFIEDKVFSIVGVFMAVLYAQMQGSYVLAYFAILVLSLYTQVYDTKIVMAGAFATSIVLGFFINLLF